MFEAHIETWMYDAETADFLVTDPGWLEGWAYTAVEIAEAANYVVTGPATFKSYTLVGPGPDNGLMYDVVFDVPVGAKRK